MDLETARLILYGITLVAGLAWLAGLQALASARRGARAASDLAAEQLLSEEEVGEGAVCGVAEVAGRPDELSAKLVPVLIRDASRFLGPVKVVDRTDDHVAFEWAGQIDGQGMAVPATEAYRRGFVRFSPLGNGRTRIEYLIDAPSGRWLLAMGGIFQLLGLVAIVAGFWAIETFILPSPNPGIRSQVFQMCQVVHLLWPPFLFASLYRRRGRIIRVGFDALVGNLPYHAVA
jgi:hypothetical protein